MKKNLKLFSVLLAISALFAGCKKDADTGRKNIIKYDDKEYALSMGFMENYGKYLENEGYNIDLTLMSSGFKIHEANGEIDSVSGTGNGIYFEMFTSDSTELDSRIFTYDTEGTRESGTFDNGQVVIDYNATTQEGDIYNIVQGTVTVSKSGSTYEIAIACKDVSGKDITGYFKGKLKYYNYGNMDLKNTVSGKLRKVLNRFFSQK
jgi:hypothetical protein